MQEKDLYMTMEKLNAQGFDSVYIPAGDGGGMRAVEFAVYESWRVQNITIHWKQ